MPRPIYLTITPDNTSSTGICLSQTPGGAGALTLNGALGTSFDYPRHIAIASGSDISNRTFTIVGADISGRTLTEVVTGPNNATVKSTLYYKTLTSITISGSAAGAITVGTVGELSTQTIPLNYTMPIATQVAVDVTGTINFSVQETFDDPFTTLTPNWLSVTALASKAADTNSQVSVGSRAIRVITNSYTNGATLGIDIVQVVCE